MEKFKQKVASWLNDDPGTLSKLWSNWLYWWHNKRPNGFRLLGLTHFAARFGLTASAPSLMYFVYDTIDGWKAASATGALFIIFSVSSFLDQWSQKKKNNVEQASTEAWVRIGDLITSVKSSATAASSRDDSVNAALGVIEAYARQITKSPKHTISVSLALYDGKSTSHMKIRHRNPGNERPTGRNLKHLERVLGHIACQTGPEPRVVSDLKAFGPNGFFSPTQEKCNYRSIVIFPITVRSTNKIKGFVSVDCKRAHAFHGNIARQLVVTTEPLINHIEEQF